MQYIYPPWEVAGNMLSGSSDQEGVAGTFEIQQGTMVALVSQRGGGKTTMLKVLGGVLLPESGLHLPPHLRVLHISGDPHFFEGTLRQNLTFGCMPGSEDGSLERVV